MDKELFSDGDNSGSNYDVIIVGAGPRTVIYGLHCLLDEFERHLEIISTRYKYIALTWLLATYAAIGFLMSTDMKGVIFDHYVWITIISMIGVIGVSLLWHLDMNIYHRFWAAVLIEEIHMENSYPFLLQSRRNAFEIDESRERILSQGFLYLISNTLLIMTMGVSCSFLFRDSASTMISLLFGCALFLFLMWFTMIKVSKKVDQTLYHIVEENERNSHRN